MTIKATLVTMNNQHKTVDLDIFRLDDSVENKGENTIEQLHIFHYENFQVIIYGWTNGKEYQINKHELPPPIDNKLYFGDLLILLREDNVLIDFETVDYDEFYNYIFGGFDSCDEDDDEDMTDESYDYDDDFVIRG